MFRNLGYKFGIIFRDLELMHSYSEKKTSKLNLLDNQEFIISVAIFTTKKKEKICYLNHFLALDILLKMFN